MFVLGLGYSTVAPCHTYVEKMGEDAAERYPSTHSMEEILQILLCTSCSTLTPAIDSKLEPPSQGN